MTAVVTLEALVIALLALLVVGLLRSHAEILRALHDLGVNLDEDRVADRSFRLREVEAAPPNLVEAQRAVDDPAMLGAARDISGDTPDGELAAVGVVDVDHPTLLAFLSSGCVTCQDFWEAFGDGAALELGGRRVRIVAVTKSSDDESPEAIAALAGAEFTTVMSSEAYAEYAVPVSPYFVLVDAHSSEIAGEGAAVSWTQLASLLDRAVADRGASMGGARRSRRELLSGARGHLA